jgi:hypothetical protein
MITRLLPATHLAVDAGGAQTRRECGIEQQVIDAQPRVARVSVTEVVPEGKDALPGVELPQ